MKPELIVTIESADNLCDALSIPKDRHKYIVDFIEEAANKNDNMAEVINLISKKADNVNELAFAIFHYGAIHKSILGRKIAKTVLRDLLGDSMHGEHFRDEAENNSGPVKK